MIMQYSKQFLVLAGLAAGLLTLAASAPTRALQIFEASLPANSETPVELLFDAPDGGAVRVGIVGENMRGQALSISLLHVADVDFSGPRPRVFYRAFSLSGSELSDDGLYGSILVKNPVVEILDASGQTSRVFVPDLMQQIPIVDALSADQLEEVRALLGLESLILGERGLGVPGFDAVVPEPGTALLLGLGLVVLGVRSQGETGNEA
jgi:hypothetical protein